MRDNKIHSMVLFVVGAVEDAMDSSEVLLIVYRRILFAGTKTGKSVALCVSNDCARRKYSGFMKTDFLREQKNSERRIKNECVKSSRVDLWFLCELCALVGRWNDVKNRGKVNKYAVYLCIYKFVAAFRVSLAFSLARSTFRKRKQKHDHWWRGQRSDSFVCVCGALT